MVIKNLVLLYKHIKRIGRVGRHKLCVHEQD